MWADHVFSTHSPVDGHLHCSHFVPVTDGAAVSLRVQAWLCVFSSLEDVTRSGPAGLHGKFTFNFLRDY